MGGDAVGDAAASQRIAGRPAAVLSKWTRWGAHTAIWEPTAVASSTGNHAHTAGAAEGRDGDQRQRKERRWDVMHVAYRTQSAKVRLTAQVEGTCFSPEAGNCSDPTELYFGYRGTSLATRHWANTSMPDVVKSHKITFATSLPMGTRGTFTHDDELWIAYPAKKNQRIFAVTDQLIGLHAGITQEMIRWINERPEDARFITRVLDWTKRAREIHAEIAEEKTRARTM